MSKIQELIIDYLDNNQNGEKYRKIIKEYTKGPSEIASFFMQPQFFIF